MMTMMRRLTILVLLFFVGCSTPRPPFDRGQVVCVPEYPDCGHTWEEP